jgi:hypothetical protein
VPDAHTGGCTELAGNPSRNETPRSNSNEGQVLSLLDPSRSLTAGVGEKGQEIFIEPLTSYMHVAPPP